MNHSDKISRRAATLRLVVENPDTWVYMGRDRVLFDGKPLERRERVYILLYKPTGYITTYKDPDGRPCRPWRAPRPMSTPSAWAPARP